MKKIMVIFGTRPEAIKLAPIINRIKLFPSKFNPIVCVTAQHRQMLDQVLSLFEIVPNYDLNIMTNNQDLFNITTKSLKGLKRILEKEKPDLILVQGDTTTTFVSSLAAFYLKIPIGHVEAGLRTYDKYQPFPEEKNRHLTTVLADYHFAPTKWAMSNLLKENISKNRIWITGNTGIDALLTVVNKQKKGNQRKHWEEYFKEKWNIKLSANTYNDVTRIILVTGHRRENFGKGFENICLALKEIARRNQDVIIVYPVHLNPSVRETVFDILNSCNKGEHRNIYLIDPLEYAPFVYLMSKSYLIITDSGGIQEEAPSLGKPVLVMRNTTERPEGVKSGGTKLIGTDYEKIVSEVQILLDNVDVYQKMTMIRNPFGDGNATIRIVKIIGKL